MRTPRMWMVVAVAATLTLAGCSASSSDEEGSADASVESSQEAPTGESGDASEGLASENGGTSADEAPSADGERADLDQAAGEAPTSDRNLAEAGLIFVTTAVVGVQADDPYPALDQIADYAVDAGGGEVDREFQAATQHDGAHGSITVKLPPTTMNAAIEHLSTYGEVQTVDLHREDISVGVTDLASRIRVAQLSVNRMEEWLATATTRDEAFELEQMFNQRLVELENLLSQQRADTHDTVLSTLTVEVYSPEAAPPPPPAPEPEPETGFVAGLTSGWDSFYAWGSDVLRVVGTMLPWLVFLGLLAVAAYYIAKPIRRWQGSRPPRPASPGGPGGTGGPGGPGGPTMTLPPTVDRTGPGQSPPRYQAAHSPQRPTPAQPLPPAAEPAPPVSASPSEPPPPPT